MYKEIKLLLSAIVLAFFCALTAFRTLQKNSDPVPDRTFDMIGCGSSEEIPAPVFFTSSQKIVPLPGWGNHFWKINTSSDSAQFYFNQGLNLFYSFHIQEAEASFRQAVLEDSLCAMAYWGLAMTNGPTINNPRYQIRNGSLKTQLEQALKMTTSTLERSLISAQLRRLSADSKMDLKTANLAYRDAMKSLYDKLPEDMEVPVLYADALMQINARNWYEQNGDPKNGTTEITGLLELILSRHPDHPAALHYYIHMMEASRYPERASAAADRLSDLMPSVAHMVHMPSHIYIRTGQYQKGVDVNKKAIAGYRTYQSLIADWQGNKGLYFTHNADMQGANAALMGNYEEARTAYLQNMKLPAGKTNALQPDAGYLPFQGAQLYLLDVQFAKWDKILQVEKPDSGNVYQTILWFFGQGMAKARTGNISEAGTDLAALNGLLADPSLTRRPNNRNRNLDGARIAFNLLSGTIEQMHKNYKDAVRYFTEAVSLEDKLRYSEPEDWRIPARWFLGKVLMDMSDRPAAIKVFKEDLADHPHNFYSTQALAD